MSKYGRKKSPSVRSKNATRKSSTKKQRRGGRKHNQDNNSDEYEDSEYSPGHAKQRGKRITKNGKTQKSKSGSRSPTKYHKETESFNRDKFSVGKKQRP